MKSQTCMSTGKTLMILGLLEIGAGLTTFITSMIMDNPTDEHHPAKVIAGASVAGTGSLTLYTGFFFYNRGKKNSTDESSPLIHTNRNRCCP